MCIRDSDTDFCATKTTTDAMYGGGTGEAGKKYTHKTAITPGADANAVAEEMDLYWVNGKQKGEAGSTFAHCLNSYHARFSVEAALGFLGCNLL